MKKKKSEKYRQMYCGREACSHWRTRPWWAGHDLRRAGLFLGRFGVNGHDPGGFELGQVQSKLVLHAGEGGGCQTVTADVLRTDRRKLRDPRFGRWFRTSRATRREEKRFFLIANAYPK